MADFKPVEDDIFADPSDKNFDDDDLSWLDDKPSTYNKDKTFSPGQETDDLPDVSDSSTEIRSIENQKAKDDFYQYVKDVGWEVDDNAVLEHGVLFEKNPKTKLLYAKYRNVNDELISVPLSNSKNPKQFLTLGTIAKKR